MINLRAGTTAHHPTLEPLEERPHLARWVHKLAKMRMLSPNREMVSPNQAPVCGGTPLTTGSPMRCSGPLG